MSLPIRPTSVVVPLGRFRTSRCMRTSRYCVMFGGVNGPFKPLHPLCATLCMECLAVLRYIRGLIAADQALSLPLWGTRGF